MLQKLLTVIKVLVILIIALLFFMSRYQALDKDNSLLGFRTFVIVSDSMKPDLRVGDMILVRETEAEDIAINDIVTYEGAEGDLADKTITHEVQGITQEEGRHIFYTKGTNNVLMDPAVYEEQIYGVVVYRFFLLSLLSMAIRSTVGFLLIVFIPAIVIIIYEVKSIREQLKERSSS